MNIDFRFGFRFGVSSLDLVMFFRFFQGSGSDFVHRPVSVLILHPRGGYNLF